jgi:hypothetical protein
MQPGKTFLGNSSTPALVQYGTNKLINNKLPLKDILFNQGRIASPLCPACEQFNENRNLWSYIQNIIHHRRRRRLTFDGIAFPLSPKSLLFT